MILIPHILVGAAIGSKIKSYRGIAALFLLPLITHFLLDMIPHYDYNVQGLMNGLNLNFAISATKVGFDFLIGLFCIVIITRKRENFHYILAGAMISILPDLALFLSWQIDSALLNQLASFGHYLHYKKEISSMPLTIEILTQIMFLFLVFLFLIKNPLRPKNKGY